MPDSQGISTVVTAVSSKCAEPGCPEMIMHRLVQQSYNTSVGTNTTITWQWAA